MEESALQKGKGAAMREIAKTMKINGYKEEEIIKLTGLSKQVISHIKIEGTAS